jgi:hypothetical protein
MSSGMPNRPLPPEIYRRRRFLALAVLAVVVWLLTVAISGIANLVGGGSKNASPAPAETGSTQQVTAGGECAPAAVAVTAFTGDSAGQKQNSFAAKAQPYIWFEIVNTTTTTCNFNYVGLKTFMTITSGPDTIWTNQHCAAYSSEATDQVFSLEPGKAMATPPVAWSRSRSSATTGCTADGNAAAAPGYYMLEAQVSGVHSLAVQFQLQ